MNKNMTIAERQNYVKDQLTLYEQQRLSFGKLLQTLRKNLLGINQEHYATLTGISRRTLSAIENDRSSISIEQANSLMKPFGLTITLQPTF